jgi:hypothetical protein
MLYSRSEIMTIIRQQPIDLQPLLLAITWQLSRGQTNLIQDNRYGLLQIDLAMARAHGFTGQPNDLLEPELNVQVGCDLLLRIGLIQFLGRVFASQAPIILQLAEVIYNASQGSQPSQSSAT